MQWTTQSTPQGTSSRLPATMPHDHSRSGPCSVPLGTAGKRYEHSCSQQPTCALQGDQSHSPSDHSACCRSARCEHSLTQSVEDTQAAQPDSLGAACSLGVARGTAPEVTLGITSQFQGHRMAELCTQVSLSLLSCHCNHDLCLDHHALVTQTPCSAGHPGHHLVGLGWVWVLCSAQFSSVSVRFGTEHACAFSSCTNARRMRSSTVAN